MAGIREHFGGVKPLPTFVDAHALMGMWASGLHNCQSPRELENAWNQYQQFAEYKRTHRMTPEMAEFVSGKLAEYAALLGDLVTPEEGC